MEDLELNFNRKTVFVTGATGFVGSWLVHALLRAGARVVCLIRDLDPESEFARANLISRVISIRGSLQDAGLMERVINDYQPQVIFHLGAQTLVGQALRSPLEAMESNVRGTYLLLEAARRINTVEAIVIASSDKAYGTLVGSKYNEDDALNGEHPYDVSKSCADLISKAYQITYGLPITIARCGNIYGGGDTNWSRIVPGTIRSLLANERPELRSNGTLVRDYLHVRDVVRAYLLLASRIQDRQVRGQAFNFSAGEELTVMQVVDRIRREMNCLHIEPLIVGNAVAEIQTQILCADKARRVLGWQPSLGFEEGLREAVEWYSQQVLVS